MKRLHLVDGTFELFRAYYALPSARAPDGREVGAVRGVDRLDAGLAARRHGHARRGSDGPRDRVVPQHGCSPATRPATAFRPTSGRNSRSPRRPSRRSAIVVWPMIEFEADDALATAAARFASRGRPGRHRCRPTRTSPSASMGEHVVTARPHSRASPTTRRPCAPSSACRRPRCRTSSRWSATAPTAFPAFPAGAPSPRQPCSPRTAASKPSPTILRSWTVPVRGRDRLAAALAVQRADAAALQAPARPCAATCLCARSFADLRWEGVPRRDYRRSLRAARIDGSRVAPNAVARRLTAALRARRSTSRSSSASELTSAPTGPCAYRATIFRLSRRATKAVENA